VREGRAVKGRGITTINRECPGFPGRGARKCIKFIYAITTYQNPIMLLRFLIVCAMIILDKIKWGRIIHVLQKLRKTDKRGR
jgi:hypothetical protein